MEDDPAIGKPDPSHPPLPDSETFKDDLRIISRDEWGAVEPTGVLPYLALPTFIRFVHTDKYSCEDDESCRKELRDLQKYHMEENAPDINFNFLIGPGGEVYEGRGWKADVELPNAFREIQGKCLDIAYMGYHKYVTPPWDMMVAAFNLLIYGVNTKNLSPFFDFQHLMLDY